MNIRIAATTIARLRGLLGTKPSNETLLLVACHSIHTFGMSYALDIAFIDKQGYVLSAHRNVGPRRLLRERHALAVLERAAYPDKSWFYPGQRIELRD